MRSHNQLRGAFRVFVAVAGVIVCAGWLALVWLRNAAFPDGSPLTRALVTAAGGLVIGMCAGLAGFGAGRWWLDRERDE